MASEDSEANINVGREREGGGGVGVEVVCEGLYMTGVDCLEPCEPLRVMSGSWQRKK